MARIGAFSLFNPISVAVCGIQTCPLGLSPLPRSYLIDNVDFILERRVVDDLGQWSTLLTELVYDLQRVGCQLLSLPWVSEILLFCTCICCRRMVSISRLSVSHRLADEIIHSVLQSRIVDHLRHGRACLAKSFNDLLRLLVQDFGLSFVWELLLCTSICHCSSSTSLHTVGNFHLVLQGCIAHHFW